MKRRSLFLSIYLFLTFASFSQSNLVSDSIINAICKTIVETIGDDSTRIFSAFDKHLVPILSKLDDSTSGEAFRYTYYRLQKFCPVYKKMLDDNNLPKDDWTALEAKPISKLEKEACNDFFRHKNYYYFDSNRDTVKLSLTNKIWIDHFKDGSYSKLLLERTSDSEFQITFIESNNEIRKSISKPGDKYYYQLIEKYDTFYLVCLEMKELNILGTFRLYYR